MTHVMLDLETLGTGYRPVILSIGAVEFDMETWELGREFYATIDLQDSMSWNLTVDASTLLWWLQQSKEAQDEAFRGETKLHRAMLDFRAWLPENPRVWGNGSIFDNRIMQEVYRYVTAQDDGPWDRRADRDYRTFKSMHPKVDVPREGVHHNALDDAKHQVRCMEAMAKAKV